MLKHYLLVTDSVVFEVETQVTIGRRPGNDICLSELSVSGTHARVYLMGQQAIVEDLNSRNGTFLNGQRVKKAALANGDTLRVGTVALRFVQTEVPQHQVDFAQAEELTHTSEEVDDEGYLRRSAGVTEAISTVPLFAALDEEILGQLGQEAQIFFANRGATILEQGDRDRSMYIIVDGKVYLFTYDNQGEQVYLDTLSKNQFFGEISLLTGVPRPVTAQALERTLLCTLSFETMREIFHRFPLIKADLEEHARARMKKWDAKRRKVGFLERRGHTRYTLRVPVRFFVLSGQLRGKEFRCVSVDVAVSGIRLEVDAASFEALPIGCELRLEISLPQPWGSVRCLGTLCHVLEGRARGSVFFLGVEFSEILPDQRERLEQFLAY